MSSLQGQRPTSGPQLPVWAQRRHGSWALPNPGSSTPLESYDYSTAAGVRASSPHASGVAAGARPSSPDPRAFESSTASLLRPPGSPADPCSGPVCTLPSPGAPSDGPGAGKPQHLPGARPSSPGLVRPMPLFASAEAIPDMAPDPRIAEAPRRSPLGKSPDVFMRPTAVQSRLPNSPRVEGAVGGAGTAHTDWKPLLGSRSSYASGGSVSGGSMKVGVPRKREQGEASGSQCSEPSLSRVSNRPSEPS